MDALVGAVYLVDYHDDPVAQLQGLRKHKAGLGHGALGGVHQQDNAVDHLQNALHLAAEVGVARGVDDVYLRVFIIDGDIFGKDCYAPLPLQVVVVEDKFAGILILAKEMPGQKHFVDQRRLTMVDVGDDCDVADVLHYGCKQL